MLKALTQHAPNPHNKAKFQLFFCEETALLLKQGLTPMTSVTMVCANIQNNAWKKELQNIEQRLFSGQDFSQALSLTQWFNDPGLIQLCRSGELDGTLAAHFEQWAKWLKWQQRWTNRIKQIARYPIIVLCLISCALMAAILLLAPTLQVAIPEPGFALQMAYWVSSNLQYAVFALLLLIALTFHMRHKLINSAKWLVSYTNPKGLISNIEMARFFRYMSLLQHTSMQLDKQLYFACHTIKSTKKRKLWLEVRQRMLNGEDFIAILGNSDVPKEITRYTAAFYSAQKQSLFWEKLAQLFEQRVHTNLEQLEPLVEPVLTMISAMFVLLFIITFLLPLYQL